MTLTMNEVDAVEAAKSYLRSRLSKVASKAMVSAECISKTKLIENRAEMLQFCEMEGREFDGELASKFGLDDEHWIVRFVPRQTQDVASTRHATIVRFYGDGRVVLYDE